MLIVNRFRFVLATVALVLVSARNKEGQEGQEVGEKVTAAIQLNKGNFDEFLKAHDAAFVDLDAPWCVWCQRLVPTWEKFAQEVKKQNMPLGVGKVDCMDQAELCRQQKIMAFPTLRWFQNGQAVLPDYKMDRTVDALMGFSKRKLHMDNRDSSKPAQGASDESKQGGSSEESEDELPVQQEPTRIPIQERKTEMEEKCRMAGLPYGSNIQRFSQSGGDEFDDFRGLRVKIAPTCQSASSNVRGTYNSFFRPCEFQFHVVPKSKRVSGSSFQLSTVCSSDNVYKEDIDAGNGATNEALMDYVRGWQDECVGDYSRCYSVSKEAEAKIFMRHFCIRNWEIPDLVTHISVSCKDDKIEAVKKQEDKKGTGYDNDIGRSHLAQLAKHHKEKVAILLLIVALTCCCCWVAMGLAYKLVIVPYLKAIKKSKSDPDLQSLVGAVDGEKGKTTVDLPVY